MYGQELASETLPKLEDFLKNPRSISKVKEKNQTVTTAWWVEKDKNEPQAGFAFTNATRLLASLKFSRDLIMNFSLYKEMSSAITKIEYDAEKKILELQGEAGGLTMHSWIRVDEQKKRDPATGQTFYSIHFKIIRGNMIGFDVQAYLLDDRGKTIALSKGFYPDAKKKLPRMVQLIFPTLTETVIGVATNKFKSYIEERYYNQLKGQKNQ